MSETTTVRRAFRLCFCRIRDLGVRCWNCGGRGYESNGLYLEMFEPGAKVVDVFTRHEWEIVKHSRSGVSTLRSTLTGREIQMNSGANPRYVSTEAAADPETWNLPEGVA